MIGFERVLVVATTLESVVIPLQQHLFSKACSKA